MGIPTFALLVISSIFIYNVYIDYSTTKTNYSNSFSIESSYFLLTELQKERGMSAAYLSGSDNLSKLNSQREVVDKKQSAFTDLLVNSQIDKKEQDLLTNSLESIKSIRTAVTNKSISKLDSIKKFSKVINDLLSLKVELKHGRLTQEMAEYLNNLIVIETAKESGGKLRANMSSFFARDTKLSTKELLTLNNLFYGLQINLNSPLIDKSEKAQEIYDNYNNSSDTKSVQKAYVTLLEKSGKGNYGYDSNLFFSTISKSLGILDELVKYKYKRLRAMLKSQKERSFHALIISSSVLSIGIFLIISMGVMRILGLVRSFRQNLHNLFNKISVIDLTFTSLNKSANAIATNCNSQSDEVNLVSSAVQEVRETVSLNADVALRTKEISDQSVSLVKKGQEVVKSVDSSIETIGKSNGELVQIMQDVSNQINQILEVINEISGKTTVINDIVFQTKLLSFNASVEAARAGEHGKGFAVVAEEVGNLANSSGKAAEEISTLIESSDRIVKEIVDNISSKVESFVKENNDKLQDGQANVKECVNIFDSIFSTFNEISTKIGELASASNEQSQGVAEISNSISNIDTSASDTNRVANKNVQSITRANESLENLRKTIDDLCIIVRGEVISFEQIKDENVKKLISDSKNQEISEPTHKKAA